MIKKILKWLFGTSLKTSYMCMQCKQKVSKTEIENNKYTKMHKGCGGFVLVTKR